MRPRRISSILTASAAAAVVCCNISSVESASVRGVAAKRRRENNIITRPHEQQLDNNEEPSNTASPPPQQQRRSLQHWWHGKKNDEKDIVYVNLGVPSNVNTNQLQALHDKQNDPTNAIDEGDIAYGDVDKEMMQNSATAEEGNDSNGGEYTSTNNMHGKSSLSVYSITTSNNPDTSNLPYRQPTKTPTPKPTQLPSTSPTISPSNIPVVNVMEQMMTSIEEEGGIYYPLWGNQFTGCTSSLTPPEVYTAATTNTQDLTSIQYLFTTKSECCNYWFINDYKSCLELTLNIQMLNDMLIEDTNQEDESDMESYSGKKSGTSNDYDNSRPPPPPPPPPSPPAEEEEEEGGGDLIFINPDIEATPTDQEEDDTFTTSDVEVGIGNSTSSSPVMASTPPPVPVVEGEGTSSSPSTLGSSNTSPPFPSTSNGIVIDVSTTSASPSVVYSTSDVPTSESEVVTPPPSPAGVLTPSPTEVMSTPSPTDPPVPIPQPVSPINTPSEIDLTTPWPTFASTMANPPTLPPDDVNATMSPTGPAVIDLEVGEPVVNTPSPSVTTSETGDGTNSPSMVASDVSSSPTLARTVNDTTIITIDNNATESNETTTAPSASVSTQGTSESPTVGGTLAPIVPTTPSPTIFEGMTELTSKPTQVNSTAGETYTPTSPWPTFSPNVKPAFEQFQEGTSSPTSFDEGGADGGVGTLSPSAGGTGVQDSSSPPVVADTGTPPPSSAGTTSGTTLEAKLYSMSAAATATDYTNVNTIIYSQSFEDGILPPINTYSNDDEYFSWSMSGNTQWTVNEVNIADSYNIHANSEEEWGQLHAVTIGGYGMYAMESVLKLSIGGSIGHEVYDSVLEHGAYVSFGIKTEVEFPIDSLIFRVNDEIMGYWHGSNEQGWESFTTYLPPRDYDGQVHELSWTYSYFGSDDDSTNHENAVQFDRLVIQATTGDLIISDTDLQNLAQDSSFIPALNLHDASSDDDDAVAAWQVVQQASNGGHVLKADTRHVVRSNPANSQTITTYQGKASMSINIITGLFGGTLHFALLSKVSAPIDVLEIHVDDSPYMAITTSSSEWQPYSVEIPQGKHVVTFTHISNPANMPMPTLEEMGQPGSSIMDGLQYIDNIDPALITPVPTRSPTQEPSASPTKYTIPPQNYCAESLSKIQETCWTVNAKPLTCNDDPSVCPQGTICWGNVECEIPMEAMSTSWLDNTPSPSITTVDSPSPGQNYCAPFGTSLSSIKEMCSQGLLDTCNTSDEPCPTGTSCWGNIQCDPIEEEPVQYSSCPEGLSSPQGLPGCCVPDPNFLGDGACDAYSPYNTAECHYDMGDCCKESCNTNSLYGCASKEGDAYGPFGFFCIDPQYTHIDEDRCIVENREWIGDGGCDPDYNTEACGWDGGDCCKETCDDRFGYYKCGRDAQPFDCRDPNIIYRADYVLGRDDS